MKSKIKNYKWIMIIASLCIFLFAIIKLKEWFVTTEQYYIWSGQSISLEEVMKKNENLGFYDTTEYGTPGTRLRLGGTTEGKKIITGYNYLNQFQEFNALSYTLWYVPKDISAIINDLPNIKELYLNFTENTDDIVYFNNLKHIEALDILIGGMRFRDLEQMLNGYSSLKDLYIFKDFDVQDNLEDLSISNNSLEKFKVYFSQRENSDRVENHKIYLDTPNLKKLELEAPENDATPITIILNNDDKGKINLDHIMFEFVKTRKIEVTGDPIKVRKLSLNNTHIDFPLYEETKVVDYTEKEIEELQRRLKMTELSEFLRPIDKDSLETFIFIDSSYGMDNVSYLENYKNIKELVIGANNIKDLKYITSLKKLQTLCVESVSLEDISGIENMENISTLCIYGENIKDYTVLEKMKNLKHLKVAYSALEKLPDLENLKSLELIYDQKHKPNVDKPIESNGRFKNAKISFNDSDSLFWNYRMGI